MQVRYVKNEDILVIELSNEKIDFVEETGSIIIHFSYHKKPVLIEILEASKFLSGATKLTRKVKNNKSSEMII